MRKNVFISNVFTETGIALAKAFRASSYYIYGVDKKEDYEGLCDRALRFNLDLFVSDASYRVRFTQIFDEIMPKLDVLVFCSGDYQNARLKDIQIDYWQSRLNTEVTAPMILTKLFYSRLEIAGGSILFLSVAADSENVDIDLAYSTSISAVKGLMEAISLDLKGKISVNGITTPPRVIGNGLINEECLVEVAELAVHLTSKNKKAGNSTTTIMNGS